MFNLILTIMKKFQFSCFLAIILIALFFYSCKKTDIALASDLPVIIEQDEINLNEATWINSDNTKYFHWLLKLKLAVGHTASQCGNSCIYIFGEWGHVDCRGMGNVCSNISRGMLTLNEETDEYYFTFLDADALGEDLDYNFPDRSFRITNPLNNEDLWLNAPEQILQRICDTLPFVIHDIWFSEVQELENQ
jgi:hypothetical protein